MVAYEWSSDSGTPAACDPDTPMVRDLSAITTRLARFGGRLVKGDEPWWDQHEAACAAYDTATAQTGMLLVAAGWMPDDPLYRRPPFVIGPPPADALPVAFVDIVQDGPHWVAWVAPAPWAATDDPVLLAATARLCRRWRFIAPPEIVEKTWETLDEVQARHPYDAWVAARFLAPLVNRPAPSGRWRKGKVRAVTPEHYLREFTVARRGYFAIAKDGTDGPWCLIHCGTGRVVACHRDRDPVYRFADTAEALCDWHWGDLHYPMASSALTALKAAAPKGMKVQRPEPTV